MNFKYLILCLLIFSCSFKPKKKNLLELELDKIQVGQHKKELVKMDFVNFRIDWGNPNKWESNCEDYRIIPKQDTFSNIYYLDFCYDEFRWWNMVAK